MISHQLDYRLIFEGCKDAIAIVDQKTGLVIMANRVFQSLLGYDSEELELVNYAEIQPGWSHTLRHSFTSNRAHSNEVFPLKRKDGSVFYASMIQSELNWEQKEAMLCLYKEEKNELSLIEEIAVLKQVLDRIPMINLLVTTDAKILMINAEGLKAFNLLSHEKVIDNLIGNVVNCAHAVRQGQSCGNMSECRECIVRSSLVKTIETSGNVYRREGRFALNCEGTLQERDLQISTSIIQLQNRKLVLLSLEDVSEARLFQRQIELKNKLLQDFLDAFPDEVYVVGFDFRIRFVNKSTSQRYGSEWKNMFCYEYIYQRNKMCEDCILQKLQSNNSEFVQVKYFEKTDEYREIRHIWLSDGSKLTIRRDITIRKKAEKALRLSKQRLQEAQRISKIGNWEIDLKTYHLIWNDEIDDIFEIQKSSITPSFKVFLNAIHPEDRDFVNKAYKNSIENKEPYSIEHRLLMPDGRIKYVVEKGEALFDKKGRPIVSRGTVQDITQRKKTEEIIVNQNEQLRLLNITKDRFLSVLAHDLKDSFNSILGFSELLTEEFKSLSEDEVMQFSKLIQTSSQNAYYILLSLLDYAKIQMNQGDFAPQNLKFHELAVKCCQSVEENALIKNIAIVNTISHELYVWADPYMLETVIRNLISNSIKFTPDNGTITLSAQVDKQNKYVEVTVADTGCGMEPEVKEGLFNIETTQSILGTNGEKGSGLGLLLCKDFVVKHGGEIWVESEINKGSEFKFTLPVLKAVSMQ